MPKPKPLLGFRRLARHQVVGYRDKVYHIDYVYIRGVDLFVNLIDGPNFVPENEIETDLSHLVVDQSINHTT